MDVCVWATDNNYLNQLVSRQISNHAANEYVE